MKRIVKPLIIALCLMVSLFNSQTSVQAKSYTYTITFYSGEQGSFTNLSAIQIPENAKVDCSSEKVIISNLNYGDVVSCSAQAAISLNEDSKYYVRGIRLGGRDNNKVGYSSFTVFEDQDYVVAYGIKGEQTSYTINYLDQDNNKLADSQTYYGNVGDEPVIAYLYIEGYVPTDYNQTRTLVSDPAENIFNFIYTVGSPANSDDDDDNNDDDDDDADDDDNDDADDDDDNQNDDNNGDNNQNDDGQNNGDEPVVVPENPSDDGNDDNNPPKNEIEEDDTPLADGDDKEIIEDEIPLWTIILESGLILPIGIVLVSIIVTILAIIKVTKKNRKKPENEEK